ncbi:hypothetical protein [Cloacibacillus evryensis]|uniref:hypothetical protein n=1 Tax=Cloacibacillus evryensis TaxID=508460 RepID=UPI0039F7AC91
MTNSEVKNKESDELKIAWFGIDGMLCVLYVIEVLIIGGAIIYNVDFVLGRVVPYSAMLFAGAVFLRYIFQVFSFSRGMHK